VAHRVRKKGYGGTRDRTNPGTGKPAARSDPSGADSATRRTRATCQLPKMIMVTHKSDDPYLEPALPRVTGTI